MTTPQKHVFTFFTNDPDPELVMFVRTAATLEDAEAMVRAAGYREFTLYEQRTLSTHEIAGVADTRILDRPFLGPEWAPLQLTIELLTAGLRANRFWNMTTYGAAYEHDPARSPCVQVIFADDGFLRLEVSGRYTARSPLTRQQRAKLKSLGWSIPDPIVVNLYDTDPGECGPPTVPDPHQFFAPGWIARSVAKCLLGTLTMVFGITHKDFFSFGDELQRAASLGFMKRVKDGPVFFLPGRDLPVAGGTPSAPESPGGAFGPQAAQIETLLQRMRDMTLDEAWPFQGTSDGAVDIARRAGGQLAGGSVQDAEREVSWLATRDAALAACSGWDIWDHIPEDADSAPIPARCMDSIAFPVMWAAQALALRDVLVTDPTGLELYERMTRPWSEVMGKVHEDDVDIGGSNLGKVHQDDAEMREEPATLQNSALEVVAGSTAESATVGEYGPQTQQIAALYERSLALTPDETARMADSMGAWSYYEWDRAWMNAHQTAVQSGRFHLLPNRSPMALSYTADALLLRDVIGTGSFTQDDYDLYTAAWREAIGPIHPEDGNLPDPEAGFGRQTALVEIFLERLANLTASEISRLRASRQTASAGVQDLTRSEPNDNPEDDAWEEADEALREAEDSLQEANDPEERGPVIGAMQDATQEAGEARADLRAVAAPAIRSLRVRHLIDDDGFAQAHYDILTRRWREAVGLLHPDDVDLRVLSTKSII